MYQRKGNCGFYLQIIHGNTLFASNKTDLFYLQKRRITFHRRKVKNNFLLLSTNRV